MITDSSAPPVPAQVGLAGLDPQAQADLQQLINQSVQTCLNATLPAAIAQGLGSVAQAQQAQLPQQPDATTMATAIATAIASQKDKTKDKGKEPSPWDDFLVPTETEATNAVALELVKLFKTPPNIQALKLTAEEIPAYSGIPVSPSPRPHHQDKMLHAIQEKLRTAMLCFVNAEEQDDKADRYVGAAFLRSAHEDIHQLRRKGAAGRRAHMLDQRQDDPREPLFTSDEEKKLKSGRGKGGGSGNSNKGKQQGERKGGGSDDRTTSRGKGKGARGRSHSASSRSSYKK